MELHHFLSHSPLAHKEYHFSVIPLLQDCDNFVKNLHLAGVPRLRGVVYLPYIIAGMVY